MPHQTPSLGPTKARKMGLSPLPEAKPFKTAWIPAPPVETQKKALAGGQPDGMIHPLVLQRSF